MSPSHPTLLFTSPIDASLPASPSHPRHTRPHPPILSTPRNAAQPVPSHHEQGLNPARVAALRRLQPPMPAPRPRPLADIPFPPSALDVKLSFPPSPPPASTSTSTSTSISISIPISASTDADLIHASPASSPTSPAPSPHPSKGGAFLPGLGWVPFGAPPDALEQASLQSHGCAPLRASTLSARLAARSAFGEDAATAMGPAVGPRGGGGGEGERTPVGGLEDGEQALRALLPRDRDVIHPPRFQPRYGRGDQHVNRGTLRMLRQERPQLNGDNARFRAWRSATTGPQDWRRAAPCEEVARDGMTRDGMVRRQNGGRQARRGHSGGKNFGWGRGGR